MRSLSEGRWIKSEYGSPLIVLETPKVLMRTDDPLVTKSLSIKRKGLFTYGEIQEPLYIKVSALKFSQEQKIELESSLDTALALLEKSGAKNLLVKRDDFETENGIKGIKAYGDFYLQTSENKILKNLGNYRSKSVKDFLLKNGISSDRINAEDLGSDQPASKGASMFSMAKNRRVEFIIIK